jgi:fluoride exporter
VRRPRANRVDRTVLAAVGLGGALGAPARYGVAQLVHVAKGTFPWATFWTNLSGSAALGLVLVLLLERRPPGRHGRAFLATGFLGAYTTYSTFAVEADLLVKDGHGGLAAAYVVASLVAGFGAVWLGMLLARALPGPSPRRGTP